MCLNHGKSKTGIGIGRSVSKKQTDVRIILTHFGLADCPRLDCIGGVGRKTAGPRCVRKNLTDPEARPHKPSDDELSALVRKLLLHLHERTEPIDKLNRLS